MWCRLQLVQAKSRGLLGAHLPPSSIFDRTIPPCSRTHNQDVDGRGRSPSPLTASTMSTAERQLSPSSRAHLPNGHYPVLQRAHYEPPWSNTSIIGVAGSSGSGKTSLSLAIINQLSLPWVVLMSMDSFYIPPQGEQLEAAFRNEYDFDSPKAIDFDLLVEKLAEIKAGYVSFVPVIVGFN